MLTPVKGTGQPMNDLQRLAAKRNFDVCMRLNGMIANLHSIKSSWKIKEVKAAEYALQALQEAVDEKWQKQRSKMLRSK
jgi:hypothetical protein